MASNGNKNDLLGNCEISNGESTKDSGAAKYAMFMQSPDFLAWDEAKKFGYIGQALDSMNAHQRRTDRNLSDISRCYSKYCLTMSGDDLPSHTKGEDPVKIWCHHMKDKYNISIGENELGQFRACHRNKAGGLVAAFTSTTRGSVFDKCAYRGAKDDLGVNWNGQLAPGGTSKKIFVDRMTSGPDRAIKSIGLFIKKQDKARAKENKRVEQVKVTPGGFVAFRDGRGRYHRVYHAEDAKALLSEEEKAMYLAFAKGASARGNSSRGRGGATRGGSVRGGPTGGRGRGARGNASSSEVLGREDVAVIDGAAGGIPTAEERNDQGGTAATATERMQE